MQNKLQILQLNVRKSDMVQQSLMNDTDLTDYSVLAISEPYARLIDRQMITSPMGHTNWRRMVPTEKHEQQWPVRSMLWVRYDIEAEQVATRSADLTAAVLRFQDREVLVVSVYIPGQDREALQSEMRNLDELIRRIQRTTGRRTDVILVGDFNRHDLLWGGDEVSLERQGEAEPIIDLMIQHGLRSLLPRGTKTWQGPSSESTIDLVLASADLADEMIKCSVHPTEHGSDHRAIQTVFDIDTTHESGAPPGLLFKNAPWTAIRAGVEEKLQDQPWEGTTQEQTDRLIDAVLTSVDELTPRAKKSAATK